MAVLNDFQVNGLFPAVVGGTGASVKYFPRLLGASIGVQSVAPSGSSSVGQLVVLGNNELKGQGFDVVIGGDILAGSADSSDVETIGLYAQTSTTSTPSYSAITTVTGVAPYSAGHVPFGLKVSLNGSTLSGIVRGSATGFIGSSTLETPTSVTALSGINFGNATPFGLVVGVTFGTSNASNSANLYQFQIIGH